jgi:hypothetical protein
MQEDESAIDTLEHHSGDRSKQQVSLTYCSGYHDVVIHLGLTHNPYSDIKTQGETDKGYREGDKSGNDKIWTSSFGVDVVGARPCSHDLGRRRSHVGVWEELSG